jgi:hypothetical protein
MVFGRKQCEIIRSTSFWTNDPVSGFNKENLLIETISSIIAEESFRWHVIYGSVAVSKTIFHLQGHHAINCSLFPYSFVRSKYRFLKGHDSVLFHSFSWVKSKFQKFSKKYHVQILFPSGLMNCVCRGVHKRKVWLIINLRCVSTNILNTVRTELLFKWSESTA